MKWSNVKALWSLVTDGWSGLMKYGLEFVNGLLKKLDVEKCQKASRIAVNIAAVVSAAIGVFVDEKYREASNLTVDALKELAVALEDGQVTEEELDRNVKNIEKCIDAWKAVK